MPDIARVTVEGAGKRGQLARDFNRLERRLQDDVNRSVRRMAKPVTTALRDAAPFDTGELRRSIEARLHFRAHAVTLTVGSSVRRDGFDYTDITRFGHDTPIIVPVNRRALKVHVAGRRTPNVFVFRKHVVGATPERDWVDMGLIEADGVIRGEERELDRTIEVDLLQFARPR